MNPCACGSLKNPNCNFKPTHSETQIHTHACHKHTNDLTFPNRNSPEIPLRLFLLEYKHWAAESSEHRSTRGSEQNTVRRHLRRRKKSYIRFVLTEEYFSHLNCSENNCFCLFSAIVCVCGGGGGEGEGGGGSNDWMKPNTEYCPML